jgi:hypothetical protein
MDVKSSLYLLSWQPNMVPAGQKIHAGMLVTGAPSPVLSTQAHSNSGKMPVAGVTGQIHACCMGHPAQGLHPRPLGGETRHVQPRVAAALRFTGSEQSMHLPLTAITFEKSPNRLYSPTRPAQTQCNLTYQWPHQHMASSTTPSWSLSAHAVNTAKIQAAALGLVTCPSEHNL